MLIEEHTVLAPATLIDKAVSEILKKKWSKKEESSLLGSKEYMDILENNLKLEREKIRVNNERTIHPSKHDSTLRMNK